jgi:Protein of unknown function (DUF3604)
VRIISTSEVVALLQRLAEGVDGYLAMLEGGVSSPAADACVATLLGLQVNSLGDEAATVVVARIATLEAAVAAAANAPSAVQVHRTETVSSEGESGYFPALGRLEGGSVAAWLSFDSAMGDQVRVRGTGDPEAATTTVTALHPMSGDEAQLAQVVVRPTFASAPTFDAVVSAQWLLYSVPSASGWDVTTRRLTSNGLESAQVLSRGAAHAVNQEAALDAHGHLHVVHQERYDGDFRAAYRTHGGSDLSEPVLLSAAGQSAWDPCLAVDGHDVVAVWSSYRDGRFKLVMRRRIGSEWEPEVVLPTDLDRHSLHPQMTTDPSGGVWLIWDALAIPDLASSGLTRFQPASSVGAGPTHDPIPGFDSACRVDVVHITRHDDGESFTTVAAPDTIAMRSAACYPRVAVDGIGRLWMGYRAMRQLPFGDYLAHMAIRCHEGAGWSPERILPASDGTCAEFAMLPEPRGVQVLYHTDGHAARHLHMCRSHPAPEDPDSEEARRREHLRMPATDRMAAGGHVGGGAVTLTTVDAADIAGPPTLVEVPRSWTPDSRGSAVGVHVQPRQHSPMGWPPNDGVERRLYWGDLHRHSNVSRCGAGLDIDAEDHYRYAEDLLGSDFWALTDHSENTSDLNWHHLKKLANTFYRPGAHTSLIGFEWTSFIYGHMNVIYAGNDGPIFSSIDAATHDPAGLWEQLDPHEALTIPHHPASWVYPTDWTYRSERFLRLVEVFQACTGSYESLWAHRQYHDALAPQSTVTAALQAGHRVGLIGSTDHGNGVAYVGLYAEGLNRGSVFKALSERRCFAATRRGIVPELRIGSATMGQEISFADASAVPIRVAASGITELSVIQLVCDGEVVATIDASSESRVAPAGAWLTVPLDVQALSTEGGPRELIGSISVSDDARLVSTAFYPPEVTAVSESTLTWSSALPPWYGKRRSPPAVVNVGVTIEGRAEALVTVAAGGAIQQLRLGELTDQRVHTVSNDLLELHARRGTGGLAGMGTTHWEGLLSADLLQAGSWYYLRVIQVDGETAWSSPIWVDSSSAMGAG